MVPVLDGPIGGALRVGTETIVLEGGNGYHDHNWGFWEGVTWNWGQVAHDDLSFVWGRILPPADAADPKRVPGFLGVMGAEGPLGFSTNVTIDEAFAPGEDSPRAVSVRARGDAIDLEMRLEIESVVRNRAGGPALSGDGNLDFLQMRAGYRVEGTIGSRAVAFTAPGAAETFVGRAAGPIE